MSQQHRFITRAMACVAAAATLVAGLAYAGPALVAETPSYPSDSGKPNVDALLGEFTQYWQPKSNPSNADGDVFRGSVTDKGVSLLKRNDDLTVSINNKAAADDQSGTLVDGRYTQLQRALIDVDQNNRETYWDAFGPIMGEWFWDGMVVDPQTKTRALQKTYDLLNGMVGYLPVTAAKQYFNFPRPSMNKDEGDAYDRSVNGENDLKGLSPQLALRRAADWHDDYRGLDHPAGYDGLIPGKSQSFPSGHTMAFYTSGLTLAAMMPEFAPQIVARAAEGGNDRIVQGAHYPLDVMGGRIVGEASAAGRLNDDEFFSKVVQPAQTELRDYLTQRGKAAGYGDTLSEIIANTKATTTGGYRNSFTDAVSTKPITDVRSAVASYTQRLTYGYQQVGKAGQAPRVPDNAEGLLRTVFPTLNAKQRRAVLAATEIDSGYPLDSTSDGWQRLNLAAAFTSKVTLNQAGDVVKVEAGDKAEVVRESAPTPAPGGNEQNKPGTVPGGTSGDGSPSAKPGANTGVVAGGKTSAADSLAHTGIDMSLVTVLAMAMLAAGITLERLRRMTR